jgi:hypothetical protein
MAEEIKVEKDIEEIRALIKDIDAVSGEVNKIESIWNAYQQSIPAKNVGDDEIGALFKKLLSKDYRYIGDQETFNENTITDDGTNSLKTGLFQNLSTNSSEYAKNYVDNSKRETFKKTLFELCEKLNKLPPITPGQSNEYLTKIQTITTYDSVANKPTVLDGTLFPTANAAAKNDSSDLISKFINNTKETYDRTAKDDQYSITERKSITEYFSKSDNKLDVFIKPVKTSQEVINKKVNDIVSKLIEISSKNINVDSRIKKDIFEKLKPKDISAKSEIDIIDKVTLIIDKFIEDHKVHSNIRSVTGGSSIKQKKIGGAAFDRSTVFTTFKDVKANVEKLKKLAADLYKRLNTSVNSEMGDSSKGEDSIFNRLFEKYTTTKEDTTKGGPFIASTELINDLKSNDLYPDEVLKIDMADKFVFIATTLFMRIIALIIIETFIDRKIITRMDTAIFWYGITMTLFLIVFVLIVNFDSYKLRIIFNYVNFHIGYSTTFSYIFQLWLFGGMIYYIMLQINDYVITSATNDEDRARLKHKVQVISMITWFFLSIGVLLM